MKEKLVVNMTDDANHGKKMGKLLDLCIKINSSVDSICKNANATKYEMYAGNHCIQTAACTKYILDEMFGTYNVQTHIVYGIMTDNECKDGTIYNHAYIYMEHKKSGHNYLIDTSRTTRHALIAGTDMNVCIYGENSTLSIPEYDDIRVLQIGKLDYNEILEEKNEFFTGLSSRELFNKVKFLCQGKISNFKKW